MGGLSGLFFRKRVGGALAMTAASSSDESSPRLKRTIGLCGGVARGDQRATRSERPAACGLGLELPATDAHGARAKQESQ